LIPSSRLHFSCAVEPFSNHFNQPTLNFRKFLQLRDMVAFFLLIIEEAGISKAASVGFHKPTARL